jgi:aminoglycoside 3-N-acetyltransferase
MREVTRDQVVAALQEVGIERGDGLLCHSAIQFFGRPQGGVMMFLQALQEVIGPEGTLAVPVFNFGFAHGEPFDPMSTPAVDMGVLAEFIRQQPDTLRTPHPMQSLAILGKYAAELAMRDTSSAFDPGSAFERMLELDFKLLLLGADIRATSMVHYSEQRAAVPYRYWKNFTGQVHLPAGWQSRTYRLFVRDLEMNPQLSAAPILAEMQARRQWVTTGLNYGTIATCRLAQIVAAVDDLLTADPWMMVVNRSSVLQVFQQRSKDRKIAE